MIRAVLDTNVFVSTFLIPERLNRLVDLILKKSFLWLISQDILAEYLAVALRPLYGLSEEKVESLLYQVKEHADWVHVRTQVAVIKRDPADDKFLACGVDGHADWIVTGDHHLLDLKTFRGVRIGSPAEFLRSL